MKVPLRAAVLFAVIFLPTLAFAAAPRTFSELVNLAVTIIDTATGVLVTAAVAIYLWGVSTSIWKTGDEASTRAKTYFFWGVIVLFVMVSIWGILRILRDTLFAENPYGGTSFTPIQIGANGGDFNLPRFSE